jgi:uncharacterized protein YbjT (DUF2867 family)
MILVTSAAGKTGLAVLNALGNSGHETRAFVHNDKQKSLTLKSGATEALVGELLDGETVKQAVKGIEVIYLICPNVHQREFEICANFIQAAQKAGVTRLVYHSVMFPQIEAMPHHWQKLRVEEALIRSGLPFTILQPASYMQNILPYWESITERGEYIIPYSVNAKFSPVDLEDVAAVAVQMLTSPGHDGAVYQLAGPEQLNSEQIAAMAGESLGRSVEARAQSVEDWIHTAQQSGMTDYAIDGLAKMFRYYDQHGFEGSSLILDTLLSHPATTFSQFISRMLKKEEL